MSRAVKIPVSPALSARSPAEVANALRHLLPRLESHAAEAPVLPFALPALDAHLPRGGLALCALHEIAPACWADMPAALGFVATILSRMPQTGPVMLVASRRALAGLGHLHGHGLNSLGFDPARLILVETQDNVQALWAMEEALRSGAPRAVAGLVSAALDLKTSRRLHLAAQASGRLLLLLRAAGTAGASAAATRWCIGAALASRDRFGLVARSRWQARLERCRNGRPGEWLVEWDHVTHRFRLAAAVADPALSSSAGALPLARAG
jgi:protein ImuA